MITPMFKYPQTIVFLLGMSLIFALPSYGRERAPFTYDLGVGVGSQNSHSYTEAQLGLNWNADFFTWRNAVFARFVTGEDNIYGLDTSAQIHGDLESSKNLNLHSYGGMGYRFPSRTRPTPFVEGGAVMRIYSVSIGLGVKYFLNSMVDNTKQNNLQLAIILAGGGPI